MDILPLTEEHQNGLAELIISYWKTRGMSYSREWAERYLTEGHAVEIVGDQFFVAVQDGEVVGSMSLIFLEGNRAEMRDFFVKPAFRGQRVGEQLFNAVMAGCQERNIRKVFAFVLT